MDDRRADADGDGAGRNDDADVGNGGGGGQADADEGEGHEEWASVVHTRMTSGLVGRFTAVGSGWARPGSQEDRGMEEAPSSEAYRTAPAGRARRGEGGRVFCALAGVAAHAPGLRASRAAMCR
jgi:hypothetical protein